MSAGLMNPTGGWLLDLEGKFNFLLQEKYLNLDTLLTGTLIALQKDVLNHEQVQVEGVEQGVSKKRRRRGKRKKSFNILMEVDTTIISESIEATNLIVEPSKSTELFNVSNEFLNVVNEGSKENILPLTGKVLPLNEVDGSEVANIKRKRGRPRKNTIVPTPVNSTTFTVTPTTVRLSSFNGDPNSISEIKSTVKKSSKRKSLRKSHTQTTLLQNDLSSVGSPVKTPLMPRKTLLNTTTLPILNVEVQAATTEAKVEAWTSRFIKTSLGPKPEANNCNLTKEEPVIKQTKDEPVIKQINEEPVKRVIHPLPIVDLPIAKSISKPISSTPIPPTRIQKPLENFNNVDFVPPTSVSRRKPMVRKDLPEEYCESPLTRAKRVDSQNIWREQQLKNFMTSKADTLKSALSTLRSVATIANDSMKQVVSEAAVIEPQIDSKVNIGVQEPIPVTEVPLLVLPPVIESPVTPKVVDSPAKKLISIAAVTQTPNFNASITRTPNFDAAMLTEITDENSIEMEAPFLVAFSQEPPLIMEEECPATISNESSIFDFEPLPSPVNTVTEIRKPPMILDSGEVEKRQRLKDRNEKAVERRKQMLQKAQSLRIADLAGKPKEVVSRKVSALPIKTVHKVTTSTVPSLQKTAILNSAVNETGAVSINSSNSTSGLFKMPLPKQSPIRNIDKRMSTDSPRSDDTFTIIPKMKIFTEKKETVVDPASPRLPEIPSDSSEDETTSGYPTQSKENRPLWANTPEVTRSLQGQRAMKPEDIFGEVQPVKLEDFFKDSGKKYTRGRTSSIWHS